MNQRKSTSSPKPRKGIRGILEPFCETGTEGIIWSLQDEKHISADGKHWSYEGLNPLADGDFLKVFNDASRKKVIWQGEIKLKFPSVYGRGIQEGVDEERWVKMFFDGKPGTLYKKDVWLRMRAERRKARKERAAKLAEIARICHEGVKVTPMKRLILKRPGPKN